MNGIAIPHGKTDAVKEVRGAIGISRRGIDYDALDGKPVYLIFLLLSSPDSSELHLRVLKRLSRILNNPKFYAAAMEQTGPEALYDLVCKYETELL